MSQTHTSCFRQILNPLFDLYYVLEIITVGNYNGLDAGPLTLLSPYILSLVNANGPTNVHILEHSVVKDDFKKDLLHFNERGVTKFALQIRHEIRKLSSSK